MFFKVLSSLSIVGKSGKKFHLLWRSANGGKAANHTTVGLYNGGTAFQILGSTPLDKEAEHNTMVSPHRKDHGKNQVMDSQKTILCWKNLTD